MESKSHEYDMQSKSCEDLHLASDSINDRKFIDFDRQNSNIDYLKNNASISFSTCSSVSTNLNFEELSARLKEIKEKQDTKACDIIDTLSECIFKENKIRNKCANNSENDCKNKKTMSKEGNQYGMFENGKNINEILNYNSIFRNKHSMEKSTQTNMTYNRPDIIILNGTGIVITCNNVKMILKQQNSTE